MTNKAKLKNFTKGKIYIINYMTEKERDIQMEQSRHVKVAGNILQIDGMVLKQNKAGET